MSAQRLISNRTSQQPVPRSDYTWEYEYYEIGPVSFEGLKAHKYSIVIGFWVGLAVFVIFMFFVLTLLTKTGAPHQDNPESSEKRFRMNSFVSDLAKPPEPEKALARPGAESPRSPRHCPLGEVRAGAARLPEDPALGRLVAFELPNFVNTERSPSFAEEARGRPLPAEPPALLRDEPGLGPASAPRGPR
ncbi:melanocortin-2 receptor accessory protein 2 [Perognathus longimembris pacificus]|uniref:melanocortin-2 receptor accessory protein 2 n=1 Tax=Perognathus longimembris pacificus TaxID=214514 RepID=UPI0020196075|nr:melanocortin-2 receptor accessory protein 2 [Perognathus longimembris pacificus]